MAGKETKRTPYGGFSDDDEDIPEESRLMKEQKVKTLEFLLGQIANYCQTISRNTIVKNSTLIYLSLQTIRLGNGLLSLNLKFHRPIDSLLTVHRISEDAKSMRILTNRF